MFGSQRENWTDRQVIALVELDMQKVRVRLILAREAIRERLQELEHPGAHHEGRLDMQDSRRRHL